jgi:hypothetical protein
LNEKVAAPVKKTELTAGGSVALTNFIYQQKLHELRRQAAVARSVYRKKS